MRKRIISDVGKRVEDLEGRRASSFWGCPGAEVWDEVCEIISLNFRLVEAGLSLEDQV
jgi:hypothetical protein